jgi:hypothetical protein
VHVVATATNVRENEVRPRMTRGEAREVRAIRDLLRWPFAPSMLPHVMQNRQPTLGGDFRHRIE